jgi:hypothetical protein
MCRHTCFISTASTCTCATCENFANGAAVTGCPLLLLAVMPSRSAFLLFSLLSHLRFTSHGFCYLVSLTNTLNIIAESIMAVGGAAAVRLQTLNPLP